MKKLFLVFTVIIACWGGVKFSEACSIVPFHIVYPEDTTGNIPLDTLIFAQSYNPRFEQIELQEALTNEIIPLEKMARTAVGNIIYYRPLKGLQAHKVYFIVQTREDGTKGVLSNFFTSDKKADKLSALTGKVEISYYKEGDFVYDPQETSCGPVEREWNSLSAEERERMKNAKKKPAFYSFIFEVNSNPENSPFIATLWKRGKEKIEPVKTKIFDPQFSPQMKYFYFEISEKEAFSNETFWITAESISGEKVPTALKIEMRMNRAETEYKIEQGDFPSTSDPLPPEGGCSLGRTSVSSGLGMVLFSIGIFGMLVWRRGSLRSARAK